MVTMQDVAAHAGVTKQTVSNVVTGRVPVRPATAARVRAAIKELGYVPNLVARSLATGRTGTVGLFIPTAGATFYADIIEEAEDVLAEHGHHLLLCTTRRDRERARAHLATLTSRSVDGLLIAGDQDLADQLPAPGDLGFPIVLCAWETAIPDRFPVVTIDFERGGYLAGRHLRELGHRHVAVLASPAQSLRVQGFRRAFGADGLTVPDSAVHVTAEPDFQGGFEAATAALAADPAVTAIFAAYDALTPGVLEAARLAGRSVPGGLSVVGLDDNPEVRRLHPALTTVSVPRRLMAREATETLLRTITHPGHPAESLRLLEPEMVVRDSSAPPARVE